MAKTMLNMALQQAIAVKKDTSSVQDDMESVAQHIKDRAVQHIAQETGLHISSIVKSIQTQVINVVSHSFGIVATDIRNNKQIISNFVLLNNPLPITKTRLYRTAEEYQQNVSIQVMENTMDCERVDDLTLGEEIGHAILYLPPHLPQYSLIEVTFTLQQDGRLHIMACEPSSKMEIDVEIKPVCGIQPREFQQAVKRASQTRSHVDCVAVVLWIPLNTIATLLYF